MSKFVCVLALCVLAIHAASAANAVQKLKDQIEQSSLSMPSMGSLSLSSSMGSTLGSLSSMGSVPASRLSESGSGSGSSCGSDPCVSLNDGSSSGADSSVNVDDAIRPVDEWIKDFKKRTGGIGSNDLYAAAKATVAPLLAKLRRNQKEALERLRDSNESILRHVEEATTQHIYQLLKTDKDKQSDEDKKEELANKVLDIKEQNKITAEKQAAELGVSAHEVAAVQSAISQSGVKASQSVIDKIANLLSSQSKSAESQSSSRY